MSFTIGSIGVLVSILVLIYRVPIRRWLGEIGWAERYFGPGGTYTALLLLAVAGFFVSLMIMTGTIDVLLGGFFERFFGSTK